ncbi:MAG TPA: glucosidase, partial [Flavisolibacter sp.]|nr:glucosidase [Flavisolibacter sp.]
MTTEHERLENNSALPVVQWGPYLSERQWGTVREDYSQDGNAWQYFPFDQAHCRTYQWGEDGLAGISDRFQNLCFAIALWNGKDNILKERLFGLRNGEGNHGEDVKELYYYLDNLPSHYYMEYLYKYPQRAFPYEQLREENRKRSKQDPEFEILDTDAFLNNQYFDVLITYAKQSDNDIFIKIEIKNRYQKAAEITVLPTLWFSHQATVGVTEKPQLVYTDANAVVATHEKLGKYYFYLQEPQDLLFTNNATNTAIVTGQPNKDAFTKDAFHSAIIKGTNKEELRSKKCGTKAAGVYKLKIEAGSTQTIYCRLTDTPEDHPFPYEFKQLFTIRKQEADEFYASILPNQLSPDMATIQRQAIA